MTENPADSAWDIPTRERALWAIGALLCGLLALIGALVLVVVIRPLVVRLLAAAALLIVGVAALVVFADQVDKRPADAKDTWRAEVWHYASASMVALAFALIAGAVVPSLLGLTDSPSLIQAVVCDLLVGIVAGGLTLGLTALGGVVGSKLSWLLFARSHVGDEQAKRVRLALREVTTRRDARRMLAMSVAGVMLSGLVEQLLAAPQAGTTAAAADTQPTAPSVLTSVVVPLLVWVVATALVWFAFVVGDIRRTGPKGHHAAASNGLDVHQRRRRSAHASALAVGLALLVGVISAGILSGLIQDSLSNRSHPVAGVPIPSAPAAARVAFLARTFVPRFELADGELWDPTTVTWYVSNSGHTSSTTFCKPGPKTEPQGCRELCAKIAGASCSALCEGPEPGACAVRGSGPHAVYYIYRDATNTRGDGPARTRPGWAVIEYWIFYNYDSLHAGLITQWHQSDWEQVSVLVQQRGAAVYPIEVAFSEHCYGAAVPASEVAWNGSHPTSFVGLGSHANYPTRNDLPIRQLQCLTRRTPRYLGAAGLFFNPHVAGWSVELPIAYLIGLRDQTDRPRVVSDAQPISLQSTPSISSFRGYWGVDNNLRVLFGGLTTGAGPTSPQDQAPSNTPFHSMFCGSSWLKAARTPDTAWVC